MPNGQIVSQNTEYPAGQVASANALYLLLDSIAAVDPGIWMPWGENGFSHGSFEVDSPTSMVGDTIQLKVSNAEYQPANTQQITLAGTPALNDVLTVIINGAGFPNQRIITTLTLGAGPTVASATTALTAAILAACRLAADQPPVNTQNSANNAGYMQVSSPSSGLINIFWQTFFSFPISVTVIATGGTTLAVAPYDDGAGFTVSQCILTAPGNVPFNAPARWIKACCPTYAAGTVTATVQAQSP